MNEFAVQLFTDLIYHSGAYGRRKELRHIAKKIAEKIQYNHGAGNHKQRVNSSISGDKFSQIKIEGIHDGSCRKSKIGFYQYGVHLLKEYRKKRNNQRQIGDGEHRIKYIGNNNKEDVAFVVQGVF
jgi:hypothetical protein